MKKTTVAAFAKRKAAEEKLVMVTAYDAPAARIAADAGIDILLVGDSVAMTALGLSSTIPMTMDEMLHHAKAVRRGAPESFVVFDMPFMSYQADDAEALRNAARALKEAGSDAVKLEGGAEVAPLIAKLVSAGIPVMAHMGLMPQHVRAIGGYKVAGRTPDEAARLLAEAREIEKAGAFSLVLECVPAALGKSITDALTIPTIGIGSGAGCSGQVQVLHDLLGLGGEGVPRDARPFPASGNAAKEARAQYADDVKKGVFPAPDNSF
ncbi:MAG: 3-methyl-2-oxobutanoate hydroxymethyltransferase [Victivallaceae bacterium]|nr:3-methyl-2-oxobutanoate hydroxymethyltransferase [Victivallaceae bacterium]